MLCFLMTNIVVYVDKGVYNKKSLKFLLSFVFLNFLMVKIKTILNLFYD